MKFSVHFLFLSMLISASVHAANLNSLENGDDWRAAKLDGPTYVTVGDLVELHSSSKDSTVVINQNGKEECYTIFEGVAGDLPNKNELQQHSRTYRIVWMEAFGLRIVKSMQLLKTSKIVK